MNPILQSLDQGYSPDEVIGYISKLLPQMNPAIKKAKTSGYSIAQILGFLSKKFDTTDRTGLSESERHSLNQSEDAQRTKFGLTMAATAAGAPLAKSIIRNTISRALPSSLQNAIREKAPSIPIPTSQEIEKTSPIPQQVQPPSLQMKELPQVKEIKTDSDVLWNALQQGKTKGIDPDQSGLLKIAKNMQTTGTINSKEDFDKLFQLFEQKKGEGKTGPKLFQEVTKEFDKQKLQPQQNVEKTPIQTQEQTKMESTGKKLDVQPETQKQEVQGNLVITPQGDIGEVISTKNGISKIDVGGIEKTRKESELESAPLDLEPAVRQILDSIPEKSKSTAFESSLHFTIPKGFELSDGTTLSKDIPIMLTKYWDGKTAFYIDFPEDKYKAIAQGLYEPKTSSKTGIAEHKTGVIDSRGAGNHQEVIRNPKYAKDNKGKTWGYVLKDYDALDAIQSILHKISKEKYDETGKLIEPKRKKGKSNKKSSKSSKISRLSSPKEL